ncbi:class I SAM-dependent methyltransferase [Alkalihalobacillus sp. MEB130]|uniref:class I SAM-dependent methyltransferase n=1 Tax=Alkalihalobacillus sp. MEB130 TaxID=2976704 RepID=UPI0028DE7EB4|nr:class I SAM-dependent methyltransferase [Alkalihalobacillus sp. MEB130]MDT8861282.1 class I SAM-dependent methyltransferase [Alkalihalobacillus sp. MEB130]
MPDHSTVYTKQTELYDQMISKQPSLLKVIEEITPLNDLDVIDMGAGSGRLTTILAPHVNSILALDSSAEMLDLLDEKLKDQNSLNVETQVADHRNLQAENESADLVVAGWTICYLASTNVENNVHNINEIMKEIMRVLRTKGTVIIFETLGTGCETPNPPEFLKQYYSLLENKYGFSHKWIRTDYQFESLREADKLTRFFFGDDIVDKVVKENLLTLPECAGVWWLKKENNES